SVYSRRGSDAAGHEEVANAPVLVHAGAFRVSRQTPTQRQGGTDTWRRLVVQGTTNYSAVLKECGLDAVTAVLASFLRFGTPQRCRSCRTTRRIWSNSKGFSSVGTPVCRKNARLSGWSTSPVTKATHRRS